MGRKLDWNPEKRALVLLRLAQGATRVQVAAEVGCSIPALRQMIVKYGLNRSLRCPNCDELLLADGVCRWCRQYRAAGGLAHG